MTAYIDTSVLLRLVLRDPVTPLGTLDAIHLATAPIWRERVGALGMMTTHDSVLGLAARTFGFDVRGI